MNIILNTAAGIFCLLIAATLLTSGWNVLAPAVWCWLERGTAAMAGAIAGAARRIGRSAAHVNMVLNGKRESLAVIRELRALPFNPSLRFREKVTH